tara:strand:- start:15818 stop:16069 length:252 start_codon:yes stop_codon:yes gene_type:complete
MKKLLILSVTLFGLASCNDNVNEVKMQEIEKTNKYHKILDMSYEDKVKAYNDLSYEEKLEGTKYGLYKPQKQESTQDLDSLGL